MMLKSLRVALLLLPSLAMFAPAVSATPFVFSSSLLNMANGTTPEDSGDKGSSSIQVGPDLASSFINLSTATMGAEIVASDGNLNSGETRTQHGDDWHCQTQVQLCATTVGSIPILLTFHFGATMSDDSTAGGEMTFLAEYDTTTGQHFQLSFSQDPDISTSAEFSDASGTQDVAVDVDTSTPGLLRLTSDFSVATSVFCANAAGCDASSAFFQDTQLVQAELERDGSLDASHTFSVGLTSLDPNFILTSDDGRTGGSSTNAAPVPEPGSLSLLGVGLGEMARRIRRRTR